METAPDGSPVELYLRLRPVGEPELIASVLTPGASVLELGCGTGRIADALVELGHPTTGVDQSPAMLAHVHRAAPVLADIEGLDLGRRFEGVVLASHLVNVADPARRRAFLTSCARQVDPGGVVLVERHDPAWAPVPDLRWRRSPKLHGMQGVTPRIRGRVAGADLPPGAPQRIDCAE